MWGGALLCSSPGPAPRSILSPDIQARLQNTFLLLSSRDMPSGVLCCPWVKTPLTTMALWPHRAPVPPLPYPHLLLTSVLSVVLHRETQFELSAVTAGLCSLRTVHIWGQKLFFPEVCPVHCRMLAAPRMITDSKYHHRQKDRQAGRQREARTGSGSP